MGMKKPTKKDCQGCYDDFYNENRDEGCWSLSSAEFVMAKDIPTDLRPPYKHIKCTKKPSCYHKQGFIRVKPENLTEDGFWKS